MAGLTARVGTYSYLGDIFIFRVDSSQTLAAVLKQLFVATEVASLDAAHTVYRGLGNLGTRTASSFGSMVGSMGSMD